MKKPVHNFCPVCRSSDVKVISVAREPDSQIIRRRACLETDCGYRWYTLQQPEQVLDPSRISNSGGFKRSLLPA